jgi:hypothetical protein
MRLLAFALMVLALISVVVGLCWSVSNSLHNSLFMERARAFPSIYGRVTQVLTWPSKAGGHDITFKAQFRYVVNGMTYHSSFITAKSLLQRQPLLRCGACSKLSYARLTRALKLGEGISVQYNPENPHQAFALFE